MTEHKIHNHHVLKLAYIYLRQSTTVHVRFNQESTERQYKLRDKALQMRWSENAIRVLDGDLGISVVVVVSSSVAVIDLHSSQIEGFFDVPITNLNCFEAFVDSIHTENLAIVAPDVGAIGRARVFAKTLEEKYKIGLNDKNIVVDKYREKAGTSQVMNIKGEVANKNCVIVNDTVDSGGTLCNTALALNGHGAKSVISCITHGVLSGSAVEKTSSSSLDKVVITDTILHKLEKTGKIEVVDILTHFIQGGKDAS